MEQQSPSESRERAFNKFVPRYQESERTGAAISHVERHRVRSLEATASPSESLQNYIREICARVADGGETPLSLFAELRAALREHNRRLRILAVSNLLRNQDSRDHESYAFSDDSHRSPI